jgi:hypothetical protein
MQSEHGLAADIAGWRGAGGPDSRKFENGAGVGDDGTLCRTWRCRTGLFERGFDIIPKSYKKEQNMRLLSLTKYAGLVVLAAPLLGGCATKESVEHAQATADQALQQAQSANQKADAAMNAANQASSKADAAMSAANEASSKADAASAKTDALSDKVDRMFAKSLKK